MTTIAEAISFSHELDLLEAHLEESSKWVDKIYVIESPVMFSGVPKKLYFEENKERFARFNVTHLITPPDTFEHIPFHYLDDEKDHWYKVRRNNRNLNRQHNWDIIRKDCDYVYLNDTDEFVAASKSGIVREMIEDKELYHVSIKARKYNYFINVKGSKQEQWRITRSDRPRFEMLKGTPRKTTPGIPGWHFTNCFKDMRDFRLKALGICCHCGISPSNVPSLEDMEYRMRNLYEPLLGVPLSGGIKAIRPRHNLSFLPKWMAENLDLFPWLELEEAPTELRLRLLEKEMYEVQAFIQKMSE